MTANKNDSIIDLAARAADVLEAKIEASQRKREAKPSAAALIDMRHNQDATGAIVSLDAAVILARAVRDGLAAGHFRTDSAESLFMLANLVAEVEAIEASVSHQPIEDVAS